MRSTILSMRQQCCAKNGRWSGFGRWRGDPAGDGGAVPRSGGQHDLGPAGEQGLPEVWVCALRPALAVAEPAERGMMNVAIYIDQADTHVHFRLFVNGALAGSLVLRAGPEFQEFARRLDAIVHRWVPA